MELFKNTKFDFLGKKWPFIIGSLVLTAAGLVSLAIHGGPNYGIDFKGGALIYLGGGHCYYHYASPCYRMNVETRK